MTLVPSASTQRFDSGTIASGQVLATADPTGVTVDSSTYADTITGSGFFTTLVFPAGNGALALAVSGDAHPRVVISADPFSTGGVMMSDGTVDPVSHGALLGNGTVNGDGSMTGHLAGDQGVVETGWKSATVPLFNLSNQPFRVSAGASGATISSGANAPAGGGNIGDLYIRTNPASDATYLYRCTGAGAAGVATWAAITGA